VAGLEEAFGIRFEDDDFQPGAFASVAAIASLVRARRGGS
jgi:acyl carrier protein